MRSLAVIAITARVIVPVVMPVVVPIAMVIAVAIAEAVAVAAVLPTFPIYIVPDIPAIHAQAVIVESSNQFQREPSSSTYSRLPSANASRMMPA